MEQYVSLLMNPEFYILQTPGNIISTEGIEFLKSRTYKMKYPPIDFNLLGTAWVSQGGKYKGSFGKRLKAYYYKEHDLKVPSLWISDISNILKGYVLKAKTVRVRFTSDFSWERGTYKDGDSCFWSSRSYARNMIKLNNGFAVQFHDELGPMARCWGSLTQNGKSLVLFNAYGANLRNLALNLKEVLIDISANRLDSPVDFMTNEIDLSNNGCSDGLLYINGGIGYIIKPLTRKPVYNYDLQWKEPRLVNCGNCASRFPEEEMSRDHEGTLYCEVCYERHTKTCSVTGNRHHVNRMKQYGEVWYSNREFERLFFKCDVSNKFFPKEKMIEVGDFKVHTSKKRFISSCQQCGDFVINRTKDKSITCSVCQREERTLRKIIEFNSTIERISEKMESTDGTSPGLKKKVSDLHRIINREIERSKERRRKE